MLLKRISNHIYYLPLEEKTDRPNLYYILGKKFSIAIDSGNSKKHLELFYNELKQADLPLPKYTIITHWHWDHSFALKWVENDSIATYLTQQKLQEVSLWQWDIESMRQREKDGLDIPFCNNHILVEYDNYIIGEQIIKIDHALLGVPGTDLSKIKYVYSHPQALMQCSDFLDEHRQMEKISLKNTAMASLKIKEDGREDQAAIAGRITADIYGLSVLEDAIQNNKNNATRFIIVTGKKIYHKGAKKISISFEIPHESGSLYHMLSHFIFNNINMTNIQSRPIQNRNWEYRFFVDFEGCFTDTAVQNALRGLREEAISLKILGTY